MAENFGKGSGEVGFDRAAREQSRGPAAARRDPRADPDDDDINLEEGRVDVVVDRSGRSGAPGGEDTLSNAALILRRELAKLHQQAAAVERTIEDQRRERTDALERIEYATVKATEQQLKLDAADTEIANVRRLHETALDDLLKLRSEREDLARAVEAAKGTAEDLVRAKSEAETLREAHDEALRSAAKFEAEIGEIRKREQAGAQKFTDLETELSTLRERIERTSAELTQAREETLQVRTEAARVRTDLSDAHDAGARVREEADRERTTAKDQAERQQRELAEARTAFEKLAAAETELAAVRRASAETRNETARLERELETARHARDVAVERATMAEKETADVRKDTERLQRELADANNHLGRAETRAVNADRSRAFVEDSVRQLRDEVTTAFARWRSIAPSVHPGSSPPPTRAVPLHSLASSEHPPATRRGGVESVPPPGRLPSNMPAPPASGREEPEMEEGWSSAPPPARCLDGVIAIPAPPAAPSLTRSVPPPVPTRSVQPPPRRATIPPAIYSVPPPAGLSPTAPPPPVAPTPTAAAVAPRREEASGVAVLSQEREDLLEKLGEPEAAREAATLLRDHPEWLTGRPPIELLAALTTLDYDVEAPIFELARAWEREAMCRAVVGALRDEPDTKLREHGAWLLKHIGAPSALPALVHLVTNEDEPAAVRRWLLEAIERLVTNKSVGWLEIGDLVNGLVRHSDPTLRDGVIGVVAALERTDDKRRILLEVLRTDDDEIVLSSAVHALGSALPIELDPAVSERLLGHPSPRVQRSVMDFIERSKRALKN